MYMKMQRKVNIDLFLRCPVAVTRPERGRATGDSVSGPVTGESSRGTAYVIGSSTSLGGADPGSSEANVVNDDTLEGSHMVPTDRVSIQVELP